MLYSLPAVWLCMNEDLQTEYELMLINNKYIPGHKRIFSEIFVSLAKIASDLEILDNSPRISFFQ